MRIAAGQGLTVSLRMKLLEAEGKVLGEKALYIVILFP